MVYDVGVVHDQAIGLHQSSQSVIEENVTEKGYVAAE